MARSESLPGRPLAIGNEQGNALRGASQVRLGLKRTRLSRNADAQRCRL